MCACAYIYNSSDIYILLKNCDGDHHHNKSGYINCNNYGYLFRLTNVLIVSSRISSKRFKAGNPDAIVNPNVSHFTTQN